ncbi:MAG: tRNA (5-methylaminomethyl-2-thiouridine)(34)-methyltransferase MnmD [Candidatus Accumulibacter sp.]|jgi:tRNA 5-methylaminomethyl-2-thiouridine biosynthesis bifunctional protein|nr:tRNA (5-methylaminomethyl-2-thiouridine)(34)-methyltransferase MnmD [Accumulibacter sp.]
MKNASTPPKAFDNALLGFDENGTPFSGLYGDVYHSIAGGPEQAEQVFLTGNSLPERWRSKKHFVILETGFGLGLNFLVAWKAWRGDVRSSRELDYFSIEKHPLTTGELGRVHAAWQKFHPLSEILLRQWPPATSGIHRLEPEAGLALHLCFGDAAALLPVMDIKADAFYLDGFSPSRNPELWTPEIFRSLARCAAPDATLATWSVAGHVRAALTAAGFAVEKHPGFGGKRHRLSGRYRAA